VGVVPNSVVLKSVALDEALEGMLLAGVAPRGVAFMHGLPRAWTS
jgi:hypothetical protein